MWLLERTYRHCVQINLGRSVKGSLLVASSTSDNTTATNYRHGSSSGPISFAKIAEPLEVPDLLALQTESFDRLVGKDRWAEQVAHAQERSEEHTSQLQSRGHLVCQHTLENQT